MISSDMDMGGWVLIICVLIIALGLVSWVFSLIVLSYIQRKEAEEQLYEKFEPCVIYSGELNITEIVLEDTLIVWHPLAPEFGHFVDLGYSTDGRLVGIKIWADVREPRKTMYRSPGM